MVLDLIENSHLAHSKCKFDIILTDRQIFALLHQINTITQLQELLNLRKVARVNRLKTAQISLQQIVHLQVVQFCLSEFLPRLTGVVGEDALG